MTSRPEHLVSAMLQNPARKLVACEAKCDDGIVWNEGIADICDMCDGAGSFYVRDIPQPPAVNNG